MNYDDYKALRRQGKVCAVIDASVGLRAAELLPTRYRAAHYFWCWVLFLSIPCFILVSIFYRWWAGLLLLFFVTPIMFRAIKQTAAEHVMEHAEADRAFFEMLVSRSVLTFRHTRP